MPIENEFERLAEFERRAPQAFRDQLQMARSAGERFFGDGAGRMPHTGIDRSRELQPVERPVIVRCLSD